MGVPHEGNVMGTSRIQWRTREQRSQSREGLAWLVAIIGSGQVKAAGTSNIMPRARRRILHRAG